MRIATIDADQLIEKYLIISKLKCNLKKKRLSNLKKTPKEKEAELPEHPKAASPNMYSNESEAPLERPYCYTSRDIDRGRGISQVNKQLHRSYIDLDMP